MTDSESKFRNNLKKLFVGAYIKKMPDRKQSISGAIGLPDYLVIYDGRTLWFEVKLEKSEKYNIHTFNLNNISESQWIEFNAMRGSGADIYVAIYLNKELYIVPYKDLQFAKFISGATSIHKDTLENWRVKWS